MTHERRKWLTVAPLVTTLTAWARRIIVGTDNDSVDVEPAPPEHDDEIVIGPVRDRQPPLG